MLAAKPMIVTDIWNDFIRVTGAGFTVKYNDIEDLSSCMLQMFEYPISSEMIGGIGI